MNDSIIHARVTSKERGVYELSYTPEVRESYTLIVKVNGTQIAGSPFQVFANIHPTQLVEPCSQGGGRCDVANGDSTQQQATVTCIAEWGKVTVFDREGKKVQYKPQ